MPQHSYQATLHCPEKRWNIKTEKYGEVRGLLMKNDNNYICKIICNVIGWGQIAILKWWPTSCHKFIWIQFQIIKHLNVSIQHHCFSVIEFIIILRPCIFTSFFFPFTLCCILNLKIWIIFLYIDMKDKVTYNTNIFHWLVSDDLKILIIKCRRASAY